MATIKSACVYCASSNKVDVIFHNAAREMGQVLGSNNITTVFGGGKVGLMGLVADAAMEAGGDVVGIIPEHLYNIEVGHDDLTELLVVDNMHTRKRRMFDKSDAFIVLPGGFGTLDEFFEILTWRQIELHDKPVILVNINGFYDKLLDFMDYQVDQHFARPGHRNHFAVVDRIDAVLPCLQSLPEPEFVAAPELM